MTYRIMELDTVGPGLLCVNDAGPISSIPFASHEDAQKAAIAYGGEEALKRGALVIMEDEGEEGVEVWQASLDGPEEEDGPWSAGWTDRCPA